MALNEIKISRRQISEFLKRNFNQDIKAFSSLSGGQSAETFSFAANKEGFIIRLLNERVPFEKDKYAFEHFASRQIPIPETVKLGKFNEKYSFSITRKSKGKSWNALPQSARREAVSELIKTLEEIHQTRLIHQANYGEWDGNGKAEYQSWKEFILNIENLYDWGKLYKETFLEKDLYTRIYQGIKSLVQYCPEKRFLVHGDFGFDNLLLDEKKITAVLDWGNSLYGDFLYDIAFLDFWSSDLDYKNIFKNYYRQRRIQVPHFEERMLCYKLYFGLKALRLFARFNRTEKYQRVKKRVLSLLLS